MPHQPTDACHDVHCYAHHVDEQAEAYLVCGECGHRYPSAEQMITDFNETMNNVGVYVYEVTDAEEIYFCAHCAHDF